MFLVGGTLSFIFSLRFLDAYSTYLRATDTLEDLRQWHASHNTSVALSVRITSQRLMIVNAIAGFAGFGACIAAISNILLS